MLLTDPQKTRFLFELLLSNCADLYLKTFAETMVADIESVLNETNRS